jgi:hypothetical protein
MRYYHIHYQLRSARNTINRRPSILRIFFAQFPVTYRHVTVRLIPSLAVVPAASRKVSVCLSHFRVPMAPREREREKEREIRDVNNANEV